MGLEIQFQHGGEEYSMGSFRAKDGNILFHFCQANDDDSLEAPNVDALRNAVYKGRKVSEIFKSVPEDQMDGLV